MVLPGLEPIAEDEITRDLGGVVKKHSDALVVFRPPEIGPGLLQLRTVEDVFLLAWGTDELTYRAADLDCIRRWTARDVDWPTLLRLHHAVHAKPTGKPTYRLVAQMTGHHGYRRVDALEAMAKGLEGKLPASWKFADENASLEIWLTIHDRRAVCGVRLSDRTMRHRAYKVEHQRASLRPTMAAAMVRLADLANRHVVLDSTCGVGTLLAEVHEFARLHNLRLTVWGGDLDPHAIRAAAVNLRRLGQTRLETWDARNLPLDDASVDRVVANPPFGKQISCPEEIGPLYFDLVREYDRVVRPGGLAVLLVRDMRPLRDAFRQVGWKSEASLRVRILGQGAHLTSWRKG
jgi:23S rRNA G2445 N2-methylase RlmL